MPPVSKAPSRSALLLALLLAGAPPAHALQGTEPAAADEALRMEELVVTGKTLGEMRKDILKAERRFFLAFNDINRRAMFDVYCHEVARTGTRIISHECRPVFVDRATEDESRAMLEGHAAPPAQLVIQMRQPEFRTALREAVTEHPELLQLLRERIDLQRRYERELRERRTGSAK